MAHVCELSGLHWETVRKIDRERLHRLPASLPETRPTRFIMDEFAVFKGHHYATVVLDADTRRPGCIVPKRASSMTCSI